MGRRKRLLITDIDSVGAVDQPDNPPASLLFWKRRKATDTPDVGETSEGVLMPDEIAETVGSEAVVAEPEVVKAEEVDDPVELAKRAAAEEVEKARVERDAAIAQLAEEVSKRLDAEWVEKARPYALLLGAAETMGPTLRKIAAACPDEWAVLEPCLRAASGRDHLAKLLAEFGSDEGAKEPLESRDRYVREMRKLHPDMTAEQARARFWEEHPEAKKALREGV